LIPSTNDWRRESSNLTLASHRSIVFRFHAE
jgi:hypothetical protein